LEYARHGRSIGGESPLEEEVVLTPSRRQLRRREAGWAIVEHLARYVKDSPDAWMFTGERRNPIRSGNRNLLTGWKDAVTAIGRPGLHFHDLRHTGNTLAAQTYVSMKDLMAWMGQDSPRAALIY
ncbi:MAG: hypothetical protein WBR33_19430, partial [Pseudonocardiaceae bacterium]